MGKNVLLVDDSSTMRKIIGRSLRQAGIDFDNIFEAADGIEALAVLESEKVDIVLSDINMPNMNGLEFIQKMKEDGYTIPIVVISTEGNQETVVQAIRNGAKGYIKKPFSAGLVEEQLEKLLK